MKNRERAGGAWAEAFRRSCGVAIAFATSTAAHAELGGVTPFFEHTRPIGIRDTPVEIDDPDTIATVDAGIKLAGVRGLKGCGADPYRKGIEHICHPRHATYVRVGDVLKEVLTKAKIMPDDVEFERYRLTIVMEAARAGMEHVTAMAVSEDRRTHGVAWIQLEQHYSSSIDDPRTMSVYVDVGRTKGITNQRIREAIDYVDAYRWGVYSRYQLRSDTSNSTDSTGDSVHCREGGKAA